MEAGDAKEINSELAENAVEGWMGRALKSSKCLCTGGA
jgi:hypothetical protein